MRISDWSSDVCSSDLRIAAVAVDDQPVRCFLDTRAARREAGRHDGEAVAFLHAKLVEAGRDGAPFGESGGDEQDRKFVAHARCDRRVDGRALDRRAEECRLGKEVSVRLKLLGFFLLYKINIK